MVAFFKALGCISVIPTAHSSNSAIFCFSALEGSVQPNCFFNPLYHAGEYVQGTRLSKLNRSSFFKAIAFHLITHMNSCKTFLISCPEKYSRLLGKTTFYLLRLGFQYFFNTILNSAYCSLYAFWSKCALLRLRGERRLIQRSLVILSEKISQGIPLRKKPGGGPIFLHPG